MRRVGLSGNLLGSGWDLTGSCLCTIVNYIRYEMRGVGVMEYMGKYVDISTFIHRFRGNWGVFIPFHLGFHHLCNPEKRRRSLTIEVVLFNFDLTLSYYFGGKNFYEPDDDQYTAD